MKELIGGLLQSLKEHPPVQGGKSLNMSMIVQDTIGNASQ